MEVETQSQSIMNAAGMKTFQHRCPCQENKCHLGVSEIIPKHADIPSELLRVQKKFFLGHGIKTTDPATAANIFLHRDHKQLEELSCQYCHGKLGVYMVPPMFYGDVPEAIRLSEFKVDKHLDRVRGDIAERAMYFALKNYFESNGDDVSIIHSHKFLNKASSNEKDFIVFSLSKGNNNEHLLDMELTFLAVRQRRQQDSLFSCPICLASQLKG